MTLIEIVTELAAIVKDGVHSQLAPRVEAVEAALKELATGAPDPVLPDASPAVVDKPAPKSRVPPRAKKR